MAKTNQTATIINLTPEAARRLIANNSHNRPLRKLRVKQLAKVIKDGRWKFNGASIVQERTGRLADGQHRCHAVIQANKAIRTVFVTGVSASAFDTIDQGSKRSGNDIFSLCGVSNAAVLSSSLTIVWQQKNGIILGTTGAYYVPDMDVRTKLFDTLPGYEERVRDVCHLRSGLSGVVPTPAMSGLHYLFYKKDMAAARCFLAALASDDCNARNPAGVVRKQLLKLKADKLFRLGNQAHFAYIKLAWNAFVAGQAVTEIKLQKTLDISIDAVTNRHWMENF